MEGEDSDVPMASCEGNNYEDNNNHEDSDSGYKGGSDQECDDNSTAGHSNHSLTSIIAQLALADDVMVDSAAESEDEDLDLNSSDTDSKEEGDDFPTEAMDTEDDECNEAGTWEEDGGPAGSTVDWFGAVAELRVVPPAPTRGAEAQQSGRYSAGCKWTRENWSCPYDAMLMFLWSLYEQSSAGWRDEWVPHAIDWNGPLANNFDHLILLSDTPVDAHDRAIWFSHYRDSFRDQLSDVDPHSFPRTGPVLASVSQILEVVFPRYDGPCLEQDLVCSGCGMPSDTEIDIRYVAQGPSRNRPAVTSLHTVWENFVESRRTNPIAQKHECDSCGGQNEVEGLKMQEAPWIWFEHRRSSPVEPSLSLAFNSPSQQLTYSLRSIIYFGGNHFTVRLREQSGRWWKHDDQIASGVPQPDNIQSASELLTNNGRFASIFIYRRDDD